MGNHGDEPGRSPGGRLVKLKNRIETLEARPETTFSNLEHDRGTIPAVSEAAFRIAADDAPTSGA
jgi:hypothetical protein